MRVVQDGQWVFTASHLFDQNAPAGFSLMVLVGPEVLSGEINLKEWILSLLKASYIVMECALLQASSSTKTPRWIAAIDIMPTNDAIDSRYGVNARLDLVQAGECST